MHKHKHREAEKHTHRSMHSLEVFCVKQLLTDNINVFLEACQAHFGLKDSQLFHPCDLEDLSTRAISDSEDQLKAETQRRLRNVAITVFWLGKVSRKYNFLGPLLDLSAFADLVSGSYGGGAGGVLSPPPTPSIASVSGSVENLHGHWSLSGSTPTTPSLLNSATPSVENISTPSASAELCQEESTDSIVCSSAYGSFRSEAKTSQSSEAFDDVGGAHSPFYTSQCRDDGAESVVSDLSFTSDYPENHSVHSEELGSMPVRYGSSRLGMRPTGSGQQNSAKPLDSNRTSNHNSNNNNDKGDPDGGAPDTDYNSFRFSSGQRTPSQNSLDKMVKENDFLNSRLGVKKSTTGNPDALQFIKTSGVTTMAERAKETVTLMKQQKEKKKVIEVTEEDWQSNLSDWKSKMRRKSSGSLQRAQEALSFESMAAREDDNVTKRKSKTFKEMMEERERRKSGGYHFYPLDDSEDSVFTSQKSKGREAESSEKLSMFGFHKVEEPPPKTHTDRPTSLTSSGKTVFDSRTRISERRSTSVNDDEQTKEEIAAWALEDDEEETTATTTKTTKTTTVTKTSTTSKSNNELKSNFSGTDQKSDSLWSRQDGQSETRILPIQVEQSSKEKTEQFKSVRSMFEKASEPNTRNVPVRPATPPKKIEIIHEPAQYSSKPTKVTEVAKTESVKKSYSFTKWDGKQVGNDSKVMQETERVEEVQKLSTTKVEQPKKNYIEKVIKISQKPGNKKGFGFSIRGGKETSSPIVVEKVVLDVCGAADVCELMPGDEIVSINGALVANHYQASVQLVIDQAVKAGQIELCIRRYFDKGKLDLFEEEEFQLEQELQMQRHQERNKVETPSEPSDKQGLPPWQIERNERIDTRRVPTESLGVGKEQFDFNIEKNVPLPRDEFKLDYRESKDNTTMKLTQEEEENESFLQPIPCPPEFSGPSSAQEPWFENGLQHEVASNSEQEVSTEDQRSTPEVPDEPPPLPAAPPPVPNWDTFPEQPTSTAVDLSFLDPSDLVPETTEHDDGGVEEEEDAGDELEQVRTIKARMEQLQRKAEFLGQNYRDTEEYRKLEELKKELELKHEKNRRHKAAQQKSVALDFSSDITKQETQDISSGMTVNDIESKIVAEESSKVSSRPYESDNSYRKQEEETALRQEEKVTEEQRCFQKLDDKCFDSKTSKEESWNEEQIRTWKSMEMLRPNSGSLKEFSSETGYKPINQEKFEQDQERMRREREERLKRAEEIENEKREQEKKLLEKELAHQRELEEIKRKRDEERRLRQEREEKERKERERREEIERRQRQQREEAERREREQREQAQRRLREQREQAERRQKELRQEAERRAEQAKNRSESHQSHDDGITAEQLRLEAEKLAQQEAELRAKEAELRRLEAERVRQIEEDQRRREEELRRYEEEQRRRDEEERREAEAIRQKELELKRLEERLRQEEEKLRQQKEQLHLQQRQPPTYKTDQVSMTYTSRDNIHKGDFEYVYQPEPTPAEPLEPESRVLVSRPSELSKTVITERSEKFEVKASPQVTPPVVHHVVKREPLIPPKPSIKADLASWSRRDVLDVSRRPAGQQGYDDSYQRSPLQARRRQELHNNNRKSWSPDIVSRDQPPVKADRQQNGIYSQNRGGSMSREDVLSMNRRSFSQKEFPTPDRETTPPRGKSPSPPHSAMTKKTLHSLGAAPKSRLMNSQQWIRDEPKGHPRRSEVIRSSIGSVSEHWLVEEAERRRVAEQTGQQRLGYTNRQEQMLNTEDGDRFVDILAPPQGYQLSRLSRSWQGSREQTPVRSSPARSVGGWEGGAPSSQPVGGFQGSSERDSPQRSHFSYSQKPANMSTFRAPVRVTEIEKPEDRSRPSRPIPEDIKQSLIERVNTSRTSYGPQHSQPSPIYAHPQVTISSPSYGHSPTSSHYPVLAGDSMGPHGQPYPDSKPVQGYSLYSAPDPASSVRYPDQSGYTYSPSSQHLRPNQSQSNPIQSAAHQQASRRHAGHGPRSPKYSPRPTESPPKPPHNLPSPYDPSHDSWSHLAGGPGQPAAYNDRPPSSGDSAQSADRAPPVPPKPPRLLSSSSEESSEQVVSVSASKRCSHCELPLVGLKYSQV